MKIYIFCLTITFVWLSANFLIGQSVGINTNTPDSSAALDVVSPNNNSGLLIPRMDSFHRNTIPVPAKGLLVFDTNKNQFYYNGGTPAAPAWTPISNSSSAQGWSLTGNAGTVAGTNFLGTTDLTPLEFRVFNKQSGYIDTVGNTSFGWLAGKLYKGAQNTALGAKALAANLGGVRNTALGYQSLFTNTGGFDNTGIGVGALYSNISGTGNVASGNASLYYNTTGFNNTANGITSLFNNTTGGFNTAVGSGAMQKNTTGSNNSALGNSAMFSNTLGAGNVGIGDSSLFNNAEGGLNTAVGRGALFHNTGSSYVSDGVLFYRGYNNTALGNQSLYSNTTGTFNVAVGNESLWSNIDGSNNAALGNKSLRSNTSGVDNTAIGHYSLYTNADGYSNVAAGAYAMSQNTSGYENTAAGSSALSLNTTGYQNVAVGATALYYNSVGRWNIALGTNALYYNTTGISNIAAGYTAMYSNTNGYGNVAAGERALYTNTLGFDNVACGKDGLHNNLSGAGNTGVGVSAGYNSTGNYNTFAGYFSNGATGITNSTAIGYQAYVGASNTIVLGNSSIQALRCAVGLSNLSDRRLKNNFRDLKLGLNFINQLKPLTYEFVAPEKRGIRQTGLIAQEVEAAAINCGVYDYSAVDKSEVASGGYYALKYAELTVPLIKAVQELDAKNKALQQEVAFLKEKEAKYAKEGQKMKDIVQQLGDRLNALEAKLEPSKKEVARNK